MKRMAAVCLGLVAGCSTAPVADLLDFLRPGKLGPEKTAPYGGVCLPRPVEPPAGAVPAPPPGSPFGATVPGAGAPPGPGIPLPPPPAPVPSTPQVLPGGAASRSPLPLPPSALDGPAPAPAPADGPPVSAPAVGIAPEVGGAR